MSLENIPVRHMDVEISSVADGVRSLGVHSVTPFATRLRLALEVVKSTFLHPKAETHITNNIDQRTISSEHL